ncbi:hypothetical protein DL771_009020 [Monosporascus sp. 5C6A]|nr:hypothetical protein DL771_009020 [Monosporascus sp. 5C6A]
MARRLSFLLVTWLLLALQVYAQRKDGQYWPCNPMKNKTCPPNPGLNKYSYFIDFTNPPDDITEYWTTSNYATVTYNTKGKNGAEFAIAKRYDAPQLYTNFYIFFGRVDVEMRVAPGRGIISSSVLMSDSFDEIDWEMSGNNFNLSAKYPQGVVQNNYFSKGIVGNYDRGMWVPLADPQTTFYTYSVDWTPTRLDWLINGKIIRTFFAKDADTTTHQFPQTPAKIQLGIWAGGDPSMNEGTVRWAGGITNFTKAPFTMFAKSVRITNYNPARYYNWTNQSGNMKSIKALNISLPDPEPPTSTSIATSLEPLRTDLPVSPNGHCGSVAKAICKDSLFGDCCSFYNYCGNTTEYCGLGCQSAFGICGPMNPIATTGMSTVPSTITTPIPVVPKPSTSENSASSNPTTITITLSKPTTEQTSASTSPPVSPTTAKPQTSQSATSTAPVKSPETTASPSWTSLVPVISSSSPNPGTTAASSSTSKTAVPPVNEKPVLNTGGTYPTSAAPVPPLGLEPSGISVPSLALSGTHQSELGSTIEASSPDSQAPTSPKSDVTQSPQQSAAEATTTTSKGPVPAASTPKPTLSPQPTSSQKPTTPTSPPEYSSLPEPNGKRVLCYWWGRWYCWYYKRAYPLDSPVYQAVED